MAATRRQRWQPQLRPLQRKFIFGGNIPRSTNSNGGFPISYLFYAIMKKILLIMTASLLTACGNNFDDRLKDEAEQLTKKHCPQQVDDITTLDSVVYDMERRTYVRYFTLAADAVPVAKENRLAVKATLTDELKNDASWKRVKDEKINFEYVYRDASNGTLAFTIRLEPADYQARR